MLHRCLMSAILVAALAACGASQTKNTAPSPSPPWLHPLMLSSSGMSASYRPSMPTGELLSCDASQRPSSESRSDQIQIRYRNKSPEPISIYAIDGKGTRGAIDDLIGHSYNIHPAKLSDTVLVADADGNCIGIIHPGVETRTIVIRYRENGGWELIENFSWFAFVPGRTVPPDAATELAQGFSLGPKCTTTGKVEFRIMEPPSHGRVEMREGEDFPRYDSQAPLAACNTVKSPDTELWFWPETRYTGKDMMVVDAIYPDGKKEEIDMTYFIGAEKP